MHLRNWPRNVHVRVCDTCPEGPVLHGDHDGQLTVALETRVKNALRLSVYWNCGQLFFSFY